MGLWLLFWICLIDLKVGDLLIVLFVSLFYMHMSICCLLLACLFLVFVGFCLWYLVYVVDFGLTNLDWCVCWVFGVVCLCCVFRLLVCSLLLMLADLCCVKLAYEFVCFDCFFDCCLFVCLFCCIDCFSFRTVSLLFAGVCRLLFGLLRGWVLFMIVLINLVNLLFLIRYGVFVCFAMFGCLAC